MSKHNIREEIQQLKKILNKPEEISQFHGIFNRESQVKILKEEGYPIEKDIKQTQRAVFNKKAQIQILEDENYNP